jgi:hypothetical protein
LFNVKFITNKRQILSQFKINVRKSQRQPQCTSQFVFKGRVLLVWVDIRTSLCTQQHPKCELVIRLVFRPFYCNLRASSNPTNRDSNSSILVTIHNFIHVHWTFFLTITDTVTSKNIHPSSWITLYMVSAVKNFAGKLCTVKQERKWLLGSLVV